MANKDFIVSHPHARSPLTINGKTLEEALAKEGLDPTLWKEVEPEPVPPGEDIG